MTDGAGGSGIAPASRFVDGAVAHPAMKNTRQHGAQTRIPDKKLFCIHELCSSNAATWMPPQVLTVLLARAASSVDRRSHIIDMASVLDNRSQDKRWMLMGKQ
jgi:hypothetical protein